MEDQNFCSEWVTLLYPNVLYNVLYECLFIINNFIIIIIIIIISHLIKNHRTEFLDILSETKLMVLAWVKFKFA